LTNFAEDLIEEEFSIAKIIQNKQKTVKRPDEIYQIDSVNKKYYHRFELFDSKIAVGNNADELDILNFKRSNSLKKEKENLNIIKKKKNKLFPARKEKAEKKFKLTNTDNNEMNLFKFLDEFSLVRKEEFYDTKEHIFNIPQ
jgi:hypothetical protein